MDVIFDSARPINNPLARCLGDAAELLVRVSDKDLDKTEEKLSG
jgi:hypothetical protein